MRIGITDSGVGGLSVCAEVEARLHQSPVREDIEIIYLNAAIEDDYSYNSMPDRQTKLQAFDSFLFSVREKYQPDLLFVACNTLSVLYRDSYFDHHRHTPIEGIVDSGTREMLAAFSHDSDVSFIVFATPTTIEEGIYGKALREHGVPASQVIEQACPGLPDAISNDGSGLLASQMLRKFVPAALEQFDSTPSNVVAFLGCTHYGYQAGQFKKALQAFVPYAQVLNPNQGAVDAIFSRFKTEPGHGSLTVKFITRYAIPEVAIKSLSAYIGELAPETLAALKNFTLLPGLCGEL
ncbi:MAG: aspartate/glutamate racemase family protein [Xanthomonadales bacterium]|nr:aspartate/glutamate racemase family protein [Xanthomonadales bacterium]